MLRPHHRRNALSNVLLPYTTSPTTSSPSPSRSGSISSTSSQPSRLHLRRGAVIYQHSPISHVVKTYRRGSDERRSSLVASVLDHVQPQHEKSDIDMIKSDTDTPSTSTSTSTSTTNFKPELPPEFTRIPSLSVSSSMNTVSTSSIMSHPSHASSASMSMSMSTSSSINDPNSVSHREMTPDIPITRERANTTPITTSASITSTDVDMTRTRSHTVMDWSTPFLSVNPMYNSWSHIDHIMIVEDATPPSLASHSLQERKYVVPNDDSDTSSTSSSDSDGFHIRRHSISSTISGPRLIQRRNAIVLDRYALLNALNQSTPTVSAVRNSPHSLSTIYSDTADVKYDDSMSMVSTPSSISHME